MNIKKIAQNTKYNAVTNTAMCAESTPVYAAFETGVAGMTDAVSLNARLIVLGAGYCGAAWVYGQGRSMWRKAFKITDQTREAKQHLHDAMYAVSFNAVTAPLLYLISGETDIKKIALATASASAICLINGGPLGYAIDVFNDLAGVRECERKSYPQVIKKQSPKVKKAIAAGIVAASIGLTALVYEVVPNRKIKMDTEKQTETQKKVTMHDSTIYNQPLEQRINKQFAIYNAE